MRTTGNGRRLVAVCCALMFAYGFFLGASQTIIESVATDLGLDIAGMGALVSLQFLPAAFVPVLMGRLADRVGRRGVISAFCAVFGMGLAVCAGARSPMVYAVGAILVGSGYSVCESGCCAAMSDLGPDWSARGINLSQALLCLAAVVSPLVVRALALPWRATLILCAGFYAILLPLLLATRFPPPLASEAGEARGGVGKLLTSGAFLCLLAGILLYVGLETGFGYFIESLISERFGSTVLSCVSLYWLGMMASRFLFSSIRYPARPVLIGCFAVSAALFLALTRSGSAPLSLALCFATGFAYGPIWSTQMTEANLRYPQHTGTASGLMSAGCGAGGILFPALTGLAARRFSLIAAFWMMAGIAIAGALLSAALPGRRRKQESGTRN